VLQQNSKKCCTNHEKNKSEKGCSVLLDNQFQTLSQVHKYDEKNSHTVNIKIFKSSHQLQLPSEVIILAFLKFHFILTFFTAIQ